MAILNFNLPADKANELWTEVERVSAFQQASTRINLSGNGTAIPVLGRATADWVERGDNKHVSTPSTGVKSIQPYTLATIIPVHKDLLNDLPALSDAIQKEGVSALATEFDETVAFGSAPGNNFHTFENADTVTVTDRPSFVAALKATVANGRSADSIVLTSGLLYTLMGYTNATTGAPVFNITDTTINNLPFYVIESTQEMGVIGAFKTGARWGTVEGIEIEVSREATLFDAAGNPTSLFQKNLIGVRVEARFGFQVANEDNFVKFGTDASGS